MILCRIEMRIKLQILGYNQMIDFLQLVLQSVELRTLLLNVQNHTGLVRARCLSVCLSVNNVGGLWSRSATKSGNQYVSGYVGVLATCMPNPTQVIIFCDLEFHWANQCSIENVVFCTSVCQLVLIPCCFFKLLDSNLTDSVVVSGLVQLLWIYTVSTKKTVPLDNVR